MKRRRIDATRKEKKSKEKKRREKRREEMILFHIYTTARKNIQDIV
jgi:hypothetical protein